MMKSQKDGDELHVKRLQVMSDEECAEIVRLLEADGDWDKAPDTIDRQPVYQQTLSYTAGYAGPAKRAETAPRQFVYKPEAFAIVRQVCERSLFDAVAKWYNTPREGIVLNWSYVRRYDPEMRPSLKEHTDVTDITVNIPLCDLPSPDNKRLYVFTGEESRGIAQLKAEFFARATSGEMDLNAVADNEEEWYELFQLRHQPRELWNRKFAQLYKEEDLLKRTVITNMGEALVHPGSYNHGVLPISVARRYSLLLFLSIDGGLQWGQFYVPRSLHGNDLLESSSVDEVAQVDDKEGHIVMGDQSQVVSTLDTSCWEGASKEDGILENMGWGHNWWRL